MAKYGAARRAQTGSTLGGMGWVGADRSGVRRMPAPDVRRGQPSVAAPGGEAGRRARSRWPAIPFRRAVVAVALAVLAAGAGAVWFGPHSTNEASPAAVVQPVASLPVLPSDADVDRTLAGALDDLRACAPGFDGAQVFVRLTVAGSGEVTTAIAASSDLIKHTTCMSEALRRVSFPPFRKTSFLAERWIRL